jgi:hypothetical protein
MARTACILQYFGPAGARGQTAAGDSVSEAFDCYICRKVMVLIGADPSRCPGCGSAHGKLITKQHVGGKAKARRAGARARRRPARK